jgi:trimeric autotransporter adhesin
MMRLKFFLLLAAAAPLYGQNCTFAATPNGFVVGAGSANGAISNTFDVATSQSLCGWSATPNVPWIHLTPGSGTGPQTVTFAIDQNTSAEIRTGKVTVGDSLAQTTVSFTQFAGTCNYQITSPLSVSMPVGGGSGTFQVTSGCPWAAAASASWIQLATTLATYGNQSVPYTIRANGCVYSRTGTITLDKTLVSVSQAVSISQAGSPNNLNISPGTASFGAAATFGKLTVNTGDGCQWNASPPDVNWIQFTGGPGSGTGTAPLTFSVAANPGPARTGHITIGTQVATITQSAAGNSGPVLTGVINNASGAFGPVSPGEIISIFGSAMGPATGVAYSGAIGNQLAGVQVLLGETPIPLLYVSASQINAIVPYGIAPSGSTTVQVQYQGQLSNTAGQTLQATAPGIYSIDYSGRGPGAILNSDYRVNSAVTPAPQGSVVMIYATGGGLTDPAGTDGGLAPTAEPLPRVVLPVSVTIGGAQAQVLYAGGAPGLVDGLIQINAVVPQGIASGPSVPLVVQIGDSQSQPGITMAVQ